MDKFICIIVFLLGFVAFFVSVITELTKEMTFLKKIPTIWQVVVLSVAIWIVVFFAACSLGYCQREWYLLVGSVMAGFFSAFIASYGWEKLYVRFKEYVRGAKFNDK